MELFQKYKFVPVISESPEVYTSIVLAMVCIS